MKSLLVRGIYHVKVSCFITFQSISNWLGEFFCSSISVTQISQISQIAVCFRLGKKLSEIIIILSLLTYQMQTLNSQTLLL